MNRTTLGIVGLALVCASCNEDSPSRSASSETPLAAALPSAKTSALAEDTSSTAPGASATSAPDDPCKTHGLTLGGTGEKTAMCKYEGDILVAQYAGTIEEDGAVFDVTNPWDEKVHRLTAAVYYYGEDGKQLSLTVAGEEVRAYRVEDLQVELPGGHKKTQVKLGPAKKDLPANVASVEVQILSFGSVGGDGATAYFATTTPFRQYRAIRGGDGPTGIAACDSYRELLESCPSKLPDALKAMRKSLRGYNNATPEIQKKLAEGLERECVAAAAAAAGRCTPD